MKVNYITTKKRIVITDQRKYCICAEIHSDDIDFQPRVKRILTMHYARKTDAVCLGSRIVIEPDREVTIDIGMTKSHASDKMKMSDTVTIPRHKKPNLRHIIRKTYETRNMLLEDNSLIDKYTRRLHSSITEIYEPNEYGD